MISLRLDSDLKEVGQEDRIGDELRLAMRQIVPRSPTADEKVALIVDVADVGFDPEAGRIGDLGIVAVTYQDRRNWGSYWVTQYPVHRIALPQCLSRHAHSSQQSGRYRNRASRSGDPATLREAGRGICQQVVGLYGDRNSMGEL